MKVDKTTSEQLRDLLLPFAQTETARQSLVQAAFIGQGGFTQQVIYSGSAQEFCTHLITLLIHYDDVSLLSDLLTALTQRYGTSKQDQIQAIRSSVNNPSEPRLGIQNELARNLYLQANQLKADGYTFEAVILYTRALGLEPNNLLLYKARGETNITLEKWDQARKDIEQALSIDPQDSSVLDLHKIIAEWLSKNG
ncbi:MAG: tetratricopeptide repeat protein [Phototrophicaceae bacterium]|jgi:tetratricopeptide (TPR) repeat protein